VFDGAPTVTVKEGLVAPLAKFAPLKNEPLPVPFTKHQLLSVVARQTKVLLAPPLFVTLKVWPAGVELPDVPVKVIAFVETLMDGVPVTVTGAPTREQLLAPLV
jgi:hypothetical protein